MHKKQSPAGKGGARRETKSLDGLQQRKQYPPTDSTSRVSVYSGHIFLGYVLERADGFSSFTDDDVCLGNFDSRLAAVRAFDEVAR